MKVTIESTDRIVELATRGGAVMPARIWQGVSEAGVPVLVFVTRIAAERGHDLGEFGELTEHAAPTADVAAWPARMLID